MKVLIMTLVCKKCIVNCHLNPKEEGLCGKIRLNGFGEIDFMIPTHIWIAKDIFIESTGLYHYRPGMSIDFLFLGASSKKRFPLIENPLRMDLSIGLATLNKKTTCSEGVFIGGLEPLIDISLFKPLRDALDYYDHVILETQGLVDYRAHLIDYISAFLFDIPVGEKRYLSKIIDKDSLRDTFEYLIEKQKHVEIAFVLMDHNVNIEYILEHSKLILDELGAWTPIHIVRYKDFEADIRLPNHILKKIWTKLIHLGFYFVYIDHLYSSKMNHTYCPENGKIIIEHHGHWIRVRRENISQECLNKSIRGNVLKENFSISKY